ncbi:MAG: HAD-IA family hydrolase [Elainellaceae cyanobacterium]
MLKALLFDLDGTIADTDPIHFQIWRDVLSEYGLNIDPTFYRAHFSGRLNEEIVKDLLPHLSVEEGEALSGRKEADFRDRAQTLLTPTPGFWEVIDWAATHQLKRAVVTNAPVENAQFMLTVLKLVDQFPTVILGEHLPEGKPHPMPYQVALQKLGVTAQEAIAFEDSPSGIRSAVGAGILTVGITSTQAPEELHALGATLAVKDFTDPQLWELLHRHLSAPDSALTIS